MIRLSCSTLSCDGFEDNDFRNTFKYMRPIGFRHAEFNMWHPDNLTPVKVRDIRHRCDETGIIPIAVYGSGFSCSADKEIAHKIRMIDAARELGCRRIVMSGSPDPSYPIETVITSLKELQPYAQENDVLICLENHVDNTLESLDDYGRIFYAIDSPYVGLCIDTGHFEAAAVALDDVVATFSNRINHIHVKENKGFGTKNFTFFGQGNTDNVGLVKILAGLGYSGFVNVELSPEIGGARNGDIPPAG
jgi:sugar phosphate isomerase/epimerase